MEDIKKMPVAERIQFVEDIWDTIATGSDKFHDSLKLSKTELAELDRRRDAYLANPDSGIPWEEVRAKLLSKNYLCYSGDTILNTPQKKNQNGIAKGT